MDEGVPFLAADCYKRPENNNPEETADRLEMPQAARIQLFETESARSVPKVNIRRNPFGK